LKTSFPLFNVKLIILILSVKPRHAELHLRLKRKSPFNSRGFSIQFGEAAGFFEKTKPHGQSLWPSAKADKGRADIGVS
jgi:hypothetical protein